MNEGMRFARFSWTVSLAMGVFLLATAWAQARIWPTPAGVGLRDRVQQSMPDLALAFPAALHGAPPRSTDICEFLVDAIVEIESAGNPRRVGGSGERGLMQVREASWREQTRRIFGQGLSFERAFEPELNRRVGLSYLRSLRSFLAEHKASWKSDERSLLLACYNAGPGRVAEAGFCISRLPAVTRDYVARGQALHDCLREEAGRQFAGQPADFGT